MTPQELKNSILQLAIQGKLVEQRPEERTAEELYKQIQTEKQALIKAGKIKKEKPLPVITEDEKTFEIPETWRWVRLNDLCSLISDGTHKTPTYVERGVPFLSVKDISSGFLDFSNTRFISQDEHLSLIERCKPEKDDVLICRIGTLGKAVRIDVEKEFSIFVSLGLIKLIRKTLADYIVLAINSGYGFSWIQRVKVGGGTHTFKINLDDLRLMPIPLPPLAEQIRILEKCDSFLEDFDRYEEAWTKLENFNKRFPEDMQKSILQMAIQGKLVPQDPSEGTGEELYKLYAIEKKRIEDTGVLKGRKNKPLQAINEDLIPFELPNTWKWVRLGNLVEIFGRIGFRGYTKLDIVEKGSGAITISPSNIDASGMTVFENCTYISWQKYEESPEIKIFDGDIIMVKTGSSYGKCGIVKNLPEKATINPQLAVLKYILCNIDYLNYVLNSPFARMQYEQFVIGTSIPTFSQEKLANMLIPLPPLAEQKRIVAKLKELLPLCEKLTEKH